VSGAAASGTDVAGRKPRRESERSGAGGGGGGGGRGKKTATAAAAQPAELSSKSAAEIPSHQQPAENPESCSGGVASEHESKSNSDHATDAVTVPAAELQT